MTSTLLNPDQFSTLVRDIASAGLSSVSKDLPEIAAFSKDQLQMIAQQWVNIAGLQAETPNSPHIPFLIKAAHESTKNYLLTITGMNDVLIEKAINAMVGVIWGTVSKVIGIALKPP